MWLDFFLTSALAVLVLFLPGYLTLRCFFDRIYQSICFAPLVSIASLSILAIVYGVFHIPASFWSLFIPYLLASALFCLCLLAFRKSSRKVHAFTADEAMLLLYVSIGIVAALAVFVKSLDGPNSVLQEFDNWMHLGMTRSFLNSDNYSSFNSLYGIDEASPFVDNFGFYPSAWHAVVALVASATGSPLPAAVNAVNFIVVAFISASSLFVFIKTLFPRDRALHAAGALVSVGVASFPWDFLSFGPLYPNLLSLALVPAVSSCFIEALDHRSIKEPVRLISWVALFLIGGVTIGISHPNGVFTLAVLLAPFTLQALYSLLRETSSPQSKRPRIITTLLALFIVGVWIACYKSAAFQSVVQFNWPATTSITQAVVDVLLFGTTGYPVHILYSLFALYGAFETLKRAEHRWLVFPYLFSCLAYILSVATEGTLKHLLSGFWYTDPHRLASLVGLFSIPLAAVGLFHIYSFFIKWRGKEERFESICSKGTVFRAVCCLVLMAAFLAPNFELRGLISVTTPFGALRHQIESQNNAYGHNVLTKEEYDFARKALSLIPDGSLVINEPNDGSGFLYALEDANLYYRKFNLPPDLDGEKMESQLIRLALCDYERNEDVKKAVDMIDAEYVILLDQGKDGEEDRRRLWSYYPEQWTGIEGITDQTPGFDVELSEGDMRLYKIDR